jgi:hypothetical protein
MEWFIHFQIYGFNFMNTLYCNLDFKDDSVILICANISAVIMTPTRELCMQIGKECKKFTKSLNLRAVCVYGGTGISEQIAELKRGAEIIVCTPGRMIDLLAANSGGSCLHSVSHPLSIIHNLNQFPPLHY